VSDSDVQVVALCAPPFSGKSTLAHALAEITGAEVLSLDRMNKSRGINLTSGVPFEEWQETYRLTEEAIARGIAEGRSLIIDSTNVRRELRERWRSAATEHGARFHLVYIAAARELLESRRQNNLETGARHHLIDKVFYGSLSRMEPPVADEAPIVLDAGGSVADWVAEVNERIVEAPIRVQRGRTPPGGSRIELRELQARAAEVDSLYDRLNQQTRDRVWNREEFMLGFVGDVGDLAKLVMAAEGARDMPGGRAALEHELADCLWSVLVLARRYDVDLEAAFTRTMDELRAGITERLEP
jgi:predicted kinase/NTP pyrophosphatase (non-canonical NTP hydrolase)